MNYTKSTDNNQLENEITKEKMEILNATEGALIIPNCLERFCETNVFTIKVGNKTMLVFKGNIRLTKEERKCKCGCEMHINDTHV